MNLSDLPDEMLKIQFPQLYAAKKQAQLDGSNDKTNVFIDQDNGQFYLQKDGELNATRYNLINANKSLKRPKLLDSNHISADQMIRDWGSLSDDNIFDVTNGNWNEIREYLQNVTRKINEHIDWILNAEEYLEQSATLKDIDLSEMVAGDKDGFYRKSEVDKITSKINEKISNIQTRLNDKTISTGVHSPSYTGNGTKYSSEDLEIDRELEEMNRELGGDQ